MKAGKAIRALMSMALLAGVPASTQAQFGDHKVLDEALELYQEYSGKTVLRSPKLPPLTEFNRPIPSSDTNGMRIVLEYELLNHGIQFIPHCEIFALAVEVGWTNSPEAQYLATLKPRSTNASLAASPLPGSGDQVVGQEAIPPGTIDFRGADLEQFLVLYGTLANRTLLRSSQISSSFFKFRTQTPLTKTGAIYMLELALALNGIAAVADGTDFIQVVPLRQVASLKLEAPERSPDEALLAPLGVPEFRFGVVNDLVARYAELTGRTSVSGDKFGGTRIVFKARAPLTKPELLYALKTILMLNGLEIIEQSDQTIRVADIDSANRDKKSQ